MPPKKKEYIGVNINDPELNAAIIGFDHLRAARLKATNTPLEDEAKKQVAELLSGYHEEHGVDIYRTDDYVAVRVNLNAGQSHIDGKKLLELGVDPEIIKKATIRNPYLIYTPLVTPAPSITHGHALNLLDLET